MKEFDTDILIVGSGLVGLVAANSLSNLGRKVILVDKKNFLSPKRYFNDTRTVAVSEGSKQFLETLSLWHLLEPYAEPIKTIKVYDRTSKNKIHFNNQIKDKKLGYVIENKKFSKILIQNLKKHKNTKILYGFDLNNIKLGNNSARAFSKNSIISSNLLIAADGKNSNIKRIVGNKTFKKKYSESALVLNFFHEKKLHNTAYEIFYSTGPLAILPMISIKGVNASTVIWSNNEPLLNKLKGCEDNFIKNFMEERIGEIVGKINKINSSQIFPLSAHINDKFINKRLVYVGDSAHSIHPIAGQGWNLGVNDVKILYNLCKKTTGDIGSDSFLQTYNEKSYNKAFQLFQITDKLNSHFKYTGNMYRQFSRFGFAFINKAQPLKNKITKYAMGV